MSKSKKTGLIIITLILFFLILVNSAFIISKTIPAPTSYFISFLIGQIIGIPTGVIVVKISCL